MGNLGQKLPKYTNQGMKILVIQDHKVTTSDKGMKIIETILFLTEITDMIKTTEMDINRHDLTRDTINSTLQTTTNIHIGPSPLGFCYR